MDDARALLRYLDTSVGIPYLPVIAGGYARDQVLNKEPRDIDVFLLDAKDKAPLVSAQLYKAGVQYVLGTKDYINNIAGFDAPIDFVFLGRRVQLICTPCYSALEVVTTFDYNVCQFWIDKNGQPSWTGPALDAVATKNMRLVHARTPWSSLRRGILMSDRFGFNFHEDDRRILIEALHGELTA